MRGADLVVCIPLTDARLGNLRNSSDAIAKHAVELGIAALKFSDYSRNECRLQKAGKGRAVGMRAKHKISECST